MKRIGKYLAIFLLGLFLFQFETIEFKASSAAAFYVQTASVLEDNTIEICVYLDGANNISGMDLELVYDSDKVSFVSSSLGPSLTSSLTDIYHDKENEKVHYVVLYSNSKSAHGILLRATFEMIDGLSYQPQLIVNELLDNSVEINEIPYMITYQQSDGTWANTQDVSGEVAEEAIIEETLEKYGAPEDFEDCDSQQTVDIGSENNTGEIMSDIEDVEEDFHNKFLVIGLAVLLVVGTECVIGIIKQKRS